MKMNLKNLTAAGGTFFLVYATRAAAQGGGMGQLNVGGPSVTPGTVIGSITGVLDASIVPVGIAMFLVGALFYTLSGEKEDRKSMGKDFMVGALIGVAIVKAARPILNLALYFIYGG